MCGGGLIAAVAHCCSKLNVLKWKRQEASKLSLDDEMLKRY